MAIIKGINFAIAIGKSQGFTECLTKPCTEYIDADPPAARRSWGLGLRPFWLGWKFLALCLEATELKEDWAASNSLTN